MEDLANGLAHSGRMWKSNAEHNKHLRFHDPGPRPRVPLSRGRG